MLKSINHQLITINFSKDGLNNILTGIVPGDSSLQISVSSDCALLAEYCLLKINFNELLKRKK